MSRCSPIAVLLALSGLTACADPPSYTLRWTLEGRGDPSVTACAESGVFQVRARVYDELRQVVDERYHPCFSRQLSAEGGSVDGLALGPGLYAIELRGVDRAFAPWDDPVVVLDPDAAPHNGCNPADDYTECRPSERVCGCLRVDVDAEGQGTPAGGSEAGAPGMPRLDYTLDPPLECEDGIDNDLDGRVDETDPSCVVAFADGTEGVVVGTTTFEVEVSALGGNTSISCGSLGVGFDRVQIWLDTDGDGNGDATDDQGDPDDVMLFEELCDLGTIYRFSSPLRVGAAQFYAVGARGTGAAVTTPHTFEQTLVEGVNLVQEQIDFGPEDFLESIEGAMFIAPAMVGQLGAEGAIRYSCELRTEGESADEATGKHDRGTLELAGLRLTIRDAHGQILEQPVTLEDGTSILGPTEIPCRKEFFTQSLTWGGYLVEVEALSPEGEVCFSNVGDPKVMAPLGLGETVLMPRYFDEAGLVPVSCQECAVVDDCSICQTITVEGSMDEVSICPEIDQWECIQSTCQSRCTSDADCFGDLFGYTCDAGFCRPSAG